MLNTYSIPKIGLIMFFTDIKVLWTKNWNNLNKKDS